MIFVILVLAAALLASVTFLFLYKRDIQNINRQLDYLLTMDTNARLSTATLDKDIGELVVRIDQMREKHKKETLAYHYAAQKMKQAITNISHDLRTPLTSSLGYLQLMSHERTSEEKRNEYARIMEERLKSLSSNISRLFEFSQTTEGRSTNLEKMNVCNLLRDCLADFHKDFVYKSFTVEADLPDIPIFIIADRDDMKRIFQNLIQNVLAHGAEYVHVQIDPEKKELLLSNRVKDGTLIDTESMFDRFYTSDFARTKKSTGLGLAIVKDLLEGIGGRVSAAVEGNVLTIQVRFTC